MHVLFAAWGFLFMSGFLIFSPVLSPALAESRAVACLGRIGPQDEVVRLSIPASSYPGGSPVARLLVEEGDQITQGQVVAILENHPRLEAQWQVAAAHADVAKARLEWVQTGAKPSDVAAQEAEIERLKAELHMAQLQLRRRQQLREQNAVSAAELDETQAAHEVAVKRLEAARQNLRSLQQPGPAELSLATSEWHAAQAEATYRKAEIEQALVRAPMDGTVLQIHTRAGERESAQGILEMGNLETLTVIAEVHESDVAHVRPGQSAEVTLPALAVTWSGVVERVGRQISRNSLFSNNPADDTDSRIVRVRIRLEESAREAAEFIHARVHVRIRP